MSVVLSPMKVPAATMANPIHKPYTTPHKRATISWPKRGGNEIRTKMAIGIKNPPGSDRTFSEKGLNFYNRRTR